MPKEQDFGSEKKFKAFERNINIQICVRKSRIDTQKTFLLGCLAEEVFSTPQ